jgi:hypothetical protein
MIFFQLAIIFTTLSSVPLSTAIFLLRDFSLYQSSFNNCSSSHKKVFIQRSNPSSYLLHSFNLKQRNLHLISADRMLKLCILRTRGRENSPSYQSKFLNGGVCDRRARLSSSADRKPHHPTHQKTNDRCVTYFWFQQSCGLG